MSNSIITIEVPEGKEAKQVTNPDGSINITFVDKEPIRSKSWEEFCKNHPNTKGEFFITSDAVIKECKFPTTVRFSNSKNHLATKEDAEGILALIQLTRLHDEWVGDWKPDYSLKLNDCIPYAIKYDHSCDVIESSCHNILEFPSPEMAEEFLERFEDLILKAKKFL